MVREHSYMENVYLPIPVQLIVDNSSTNVSWDDKYFSHTILKTLMHAKRSEGEKCILPKSYENQTIEIL